MITVKLKGGLGNQMFQYALGRTLAVQNNTELELDLSWFTQQSKERSFQLNDYSINAHISTKSLTPNLLQKISGKKHIKEEVSYFTEEIMDLQNNIYLDGYWQSYKYFSHIKDILKKDFTLKKTSKSFKQLHKEIQKNSSIAIHIRRGDFADPNIHKDHFALPIKYYLKSAAHIEKRTKNTLVKYIFSDDIEWVKKNISLPNTHYIDKETYSLSDTEEQNLMRTCTHTVISNSSFSWWAAWLGETEKSIIISPSTWVYKEKDKIEDRIPPEWVILES